MSSALTCRSLLKTSHMAIGATLFSAPAIAAPAVGSTEKLIHLNLNENAFGPSPNLTSAIQLEFSNLSRYADAHAAQAFAE
jgi:histidinol-phosphate aminotransferase